MLLHYKDYHIIMLVFFRLISISVGRECRKPHGGDYFSVLMKGSIIYDSVSWLYRLGVSLPAVQFAARTVKTGMPLKMKPDIHVRMISRLDAYPK